MSDPKTIPDKSNFLEKFAAIESYLQGSIQSNTEPKIEEKSYNETTNSLENEEIVIPNETVSETSSVHLKCTNCGADRNPQHAFCFSCGQKYDLSSTSQTSEPELHTNSLPEPELKCTECGTPHEMDDIFCMNCGKKL